METKKVVYREGMYRVILLSCSDFSFEVGGILSPYSFYSVARNISSEHTMRAGPFNTLEAAKAYIKRPKRIRIFHPEQDPIFLHVNCPCFNEPIIKCE